MATKAVLIVSTLIGIALLALVLQQVGLIEIIDTLKLFSFTEFFVIAILLTFYHQIIPIWRWQIILKAAGSDISFTKAFAAKLSGYTVSYLTPVARMGGEPVRAIVLKKESKVPLKVGIATIISDKAVEFSSAFLFMLGGLFFLLTGYHLTTNMTLTILGIMIFFALITYLFYTKTMSKEGFITTVFRIFRIDRIKRIKREKINIARMESNITDFFKKKKKALAYSFGLSFIQFLLFLIAIKLLVSFLGSDITIMQSLLLYVFIAIGTAMPIPASIGSYEGGLAIGTALLGIGSNIGVVIALVTRALEVFVICMGLFVLPFFGVKFVLALLQKYRTTKKQKAK